MLASSVAIAAAAAVTGHMTAPLWRGIDAIVVECPADATLCEDAVAEAQKGAPVPVTAMGPEGAPDAVGTLILAIRLVTDGDAAIEISARRAAAIDESQGELLPKRFAISSRKDRAGIAAALRTALDRTLPWRAPN